MPEVVSPFVDCHVFRRVDGGDQWLIMKRAPHVILPGTWQLVQGHIEEGEKAYETAIRELQEESGNSPINFYQVSYINRFYLAARDQVIMSPVFCAELAADAVIELSDEHTDFRWVSWQEAFDTYPWPGQKKSLKIAREQFVLNEPRPESRLNNLVGLPSEGEGLPAPQ